MHICPPLVFTRAYHTTCNMEKNNRLSCMLASLVLKVPFNAQPNLGADPLSLTELGAVLTPCVPFLFLAHDLYWPYGVHVYVSPSEGSCLVKL
jgi:hypothetical protein